MWLPHLGLPPSFSPFPAPHNHHPPIFGDCSPTFYEYQGFGWRSHHCILTELEFSAHPSPPTCGKSFVHSSLSALGAQYSTCRAHCPIISSQTGSFTNLLGLSPSHSLNSMKHENELRWQIQPIIGHLLYAKHYTNSSYKPQIGEVTCSRPHDSGGRKQFEPISNSFLSTDALCCRL